MSKLRDLDDPERIKTSICTSQVSEAYKQLLTDAYEYFVQFRWLSWTKPKFTREDVPIFLPFGSELDAFISNTKEKLGKKELAVKTQFLEAETIRMNDKHEDRTEEKDRRTKLFERVQRPSEDEKTLTILKDGESRLTPEQLQDAEFMAQRKQKIADLEQKVGQAKPQ